MTSKQHGYLLVTYLDGSVNNHGRSCFNFGSGDAREKGFVLLWNKGRDTTTGSCGQESNKAEKDGTRHGQSAEIQQPKI
jgi:hypothetical protein